MRRFGEILSAHRPSYSTLWSALVYVTLRYLAFARANSTFGDSTGYHESSHFPLLSERFLVGRRSFPVPLFWKIVDGSETTIAAAQLGLSVLCWWFLAQTVASMVHGRWMRVAAFWAILLFSLSDTIVQWDRDLLSESVTLSLTAALFALSLRVVARPTPVLVGATLVVGLLWGFARDSNSAAVAVLVPVLLVVFVRSKSRPALVAALAACAIFAADTVSAQIGHRADTSIQDLVQTRLFVDQPSARSWMEARGYTWSGASNTIPLYRSYLLHHPWFTLSGPLRNRPSYSDGPVTPNRLAALYTPHLGYEKSTPRWRFPIAAQRVISPARPAVLAVWLVIASAACALAWRRGFDRRAVVPLVALAATYPQFVAVWNGDEHEVDRHALIPSTIVRICLITLFLFALSALLERRASVTEKRGRAAAPMLRGIRHAR